jgi:predicted CXXCH cytochrome family protein
MLSEKRTRMWARRVLVTWPRVVVRPYRRLAGTLLGALAAACLMGDVHAQSEDSRVCAGCHPKVWETYHRTGMGRSFYRPSPERMVEDFTGKNTFYHQPSDSYFRMHRRDGKYYQERYQIDSSGEPVNVMEKQIDYIMGSGNHSRAYLHRTAANTLVELPLAWYAEKGGYWAMNPGYDRPDHDGFRRPITYDCMFCHNAYPGIPAGHEQPFSQPVYSGALPEGIDCQRCHGPGSRHAQLAATAGAKREDIRNAIVNPSRLSAQRQMEVCMACHLETTSFPLPNAIQRYDRGPFSYRPGEPLSDFILNFDHAPGTGREDKFEIVNAAYRLRRSACFLQSNGKMLCTTCHNPHDIPRGEEAARHYTAVCRQCHASDFDKLVAAGKHTRADGCVDCHMPKRRTEDVVHVAATDHYIQRRKPTGDLLAERPERQETGADKYRGPVALYYPETLPHTPDNDLYLAVAQVKQGSNLAQGIGQLTAAIEKHSPQRAEFYLDLADALQDNGQLAKALPVYREAVRRNPKFALGLQKLGKALRRSEQYPEAADVLKQAATLAPEGALTWHELGLTYRALGRSGEAVAAIGKAVELDPDLPEGHNNLGIIWFAGGEQGRAEAAFREAIRIRPEYADAHGNLANLLSGAGTFVEARDQFEIALRQRPGDAATRYNYAMLLGRTGHFDEAQRELEASLRADPEFADAHQLLGDLLMAKSQAKDAVPHYREVLRIKPESSRAQFGLGAALVATGDVGSAVPYLQKAAAGPDAATRTQAAEMLRQLGKER